MLREDASKVAGVGLNKLELVVMMMVMGMMMMMMMMMRRRRRRRRSVKFIGDIIMWGVMYLNRLDLAKENMHMTPKIEVQPVKNPPAPLAQYILSFLIIHTLASYFVLVLTTMFDMHSKVLKQHGNWSFHVS